MKIRKALKIFGVVSIIALITMAIMLVPVIRIIIDDMRTPDYEEEAQNDFISYKEEFEKVLNELSLLEESLSIDNENYNDQEYIAKDLAELFFENLNYKKIIKSNYEIEFIKGYGSGMSVIGILSPLKKDWKPTIKLSIKALDENGKWYSFSEHML